MTDDNGTWSGRLADFLIHHRLLLLIIAGMITAAAAVPALVPALRLKFDQSLESLYAPDDRKLLDYLQSKSLFGGDEFVIVAFPDANLFSDDDTSLSPESQSSITEFAEKLNTVPGVQAESTQHLAKALKFPYGRERLRGLLEGMLVGRDAQVTAVVLRLKPNLSPERLGETVRIIRELAGEHNPRAFVVGEPVQIHDMFRIVQEDGHTLFLVSLVLLAGVLFALFGSVRWVLLPLMVVGATILWTESLLVISKMRLSMVSSMLNSLVTIIGIATVTHVTVHFREHRRAHERIEALRRTIAELAPAIFWTCATTAVGFAALLSSRITPVQSFGTMMSLGALLVLATAVIILPGGVLLSRFSPDPRDTPAEQRLIRFLSGMTRSVQKYPSVFAIGSVLLTSWAACGFLWLDVETDFSRNFRSSSPIVQSLNFVETRLGGAGTWEVNFPAPAELTDDYLDQIRRLAEQLSSELVDSEFSDTTSPRLTKVVALTDGLDMVPEILIIANTIQKRLRLLGRFQPEFEPSLYNAKQERMRFLLRARERQPSETKLALIEKVESLAQEVFPQAKATGPFVLLTYLIQSLLRDQLVSFGLASLGIGAMMTVAFRSLRIGLISLVPNLFPIVLLIGTMGWLGVPINIGTAMIASVSMGLTVDASIHYLSGYRRARSRGSDFSTALRETHEGVGRALVFATLALMVGFSVLTLSQFIPLVYFGILVSAAMLGGLIGNLVLLPLLLQWAERPLRPDAG